MSTTYLTRGQAHELVDAAYQMSGLLHLTVAWIGHDDYDDSPEELRDMLHDYVDERIMNGEHERAYGPSDSDPTDLQDVDFDALPEEPC